MISEAKTSILKAIESARGLADFWINQRKHPRYGTSIL